MQEVEGADMHGVGGQHEGGPLGDAVPLDHHVLVSLPAERGTGDRNNLISGLWTLDIQMEKGVGALETGAKPREMSPEGGELVEGEGGMVQYRGAAIILSWHFACQP